MLNFFRFSPVSWHGLLALLCFWVGISATSDLDFSIRVFSLAVWAFVLGFFHVLAIYRFHAARDFDQTIGWEQLRFTAVLCLLLFFLVLLTGRGGGVGVLGFLRSFWVFDSAFALRFYLSSAVWMFALPHVLLILLDVLEKIPAAEYPDSGRGDARPDWTDTSVEIWLRMFVRLSPYRRRRAFGYLFPAKMSVGAGFQEFQKQLEKHYDGLQVHAERGDEARWRFFTPVFWRLGRRYLDPAVPFRLQGLRENDRVYAEEVFFEKNAGEASFSTAVSSD